jgi:hypothetical protein
MSNKHRIVDYLHVIVRFLDLDFQAAAPGYFRPIMDFVSESSAEEADAESVVTDEYAAEVSSTSTPA